VDLFGDVKEKHLTSGLNLVNPLAHIEKMSIQTQIIEMAEYVPTKKKE